MDQCSLSILYLFCSVLWLLYIVKRTKLICKLVDLHSPFCTLNVSSCCVFLIVLVIMSPVIVIDFSLTMFVEKKRKCACVC